MSKHPLYWKKACRHLSKTDPVLARIIKNYPGEILQSRGSSFFTLARSIVGQQISVKAAETVWSRFAALVPEITPSCVLNLSKSQMRGAGLSERKAEYLQDLSRHFATGTINPRTWTALQDEDIIQDLIQVRGIGRWSAEMFLIFHLLRPDVLPLDDIGLLRAIESAYQLRRRPSEAKVNKISAAWRPYRSVATWYLWRSLDPIPVEY